MVRFKSLVVWGLVAGVLAGPIFSGSVLAKQGPPPQRVQECQAVLPSQTVDPILARYRERLQTARTAMVNEERALRNLLVADATTRAALDSQIARTNDARNAFARVRLDMLWELRFVIPSQDRERAFRCAARLLMRRR